LKQHIYYLLLYLGTTSVINKKIFLIGSTTNVVKFVRNVEYKAGIYDSTLNVKHGWSYNMV